MAAQSLVAVKVLVQPEQDSLEVMATLVLRSVAPEAALSWPAGVRRIVLCPGTG